MSSRRHASPHPRLFRHRDGVLPNLLAFAYAFGGYCAGWWLITHAAWLPAVAGTLLLAHAMIIAAYLIHECAHNTIFADNANNARLGTVLLWLTGACYGTYEGIRHKHFRHHGDRADVVAFNYRTHLLRHPVLLRALRALEWMQIPAMDVLMHWLVPLLPFILPSRRGERARVAAVLLVRGSLFALVGVYAPAALFCYAIAYLLMLHVLRFMDAFQHTYELFETLERPPGAEARQFDAAFEQSHTYSNPHSMRRPWLNLLTLNFGYHNAHHQKPNQPWYRLPALHHELFGDELPQLIPFANQIASYHRYRVGRLVNEDPVDFDVIGNRGATFVGVDGVSFLTAGWTRAEHPAVTAVTRFWPLLCGIHRYEKTLSTRATGAGVIIEAPILAYLIETRNGRILYDVGCDYRKVSDPLLRARWYENPAFPFGPPEIDEENRLPARLARLALDIRDIDCVVCGHLHFDHGGGLHELAHADVHVHGRELAAMREPADAAYFSDDFRHRVRWRLHEGDFSLAAGVDAIETPGHTAGHMSLCIELPKGAPLVLCGDAADLQENLDAEIAPGLCWRDDEELALASIRKLKRIAAASRAELWPNHDMAFFCAHNCFPAGRE